MKTEAIIMTLDFGKNHFNAIVLDKQLRLVSDSGNILSIPDDNQRMFPERDKQVLNQLIDFFKRG